jgi:AraC family transcriptional regulator of adaptative response/methylated-DNA-[protein]-cysteine methyltransferase
VSLAELSEHAGVSASHLQRSFKRVVGMSPKEYQHTRRVEQFKSRLRAGDTVSRATYEAGFGSSSRVYENADVMLGMTPASFRRGGAGVRIEYTIASAPVGRVLVATTDRGVCAVELGASDDDVTRALAADFPNATIERSDRAHGDWVRAVLERVRDPRNARGDIPLDVAGTSFQQQVWKALRDIPAGERRSYREVAASIGRPSATRAVARACATNRVAVVIPCHRVVREDGALSGYKWGVERKRRLLDDEQG